MLLNCIPNHNRLLSTSDGEEYKNLGVSQMVLLQWQKIRIQLQYARKRGLAKHVAPMLAYKRPLTYGE